MYSHGDLVPLPPLPADLHVYNSIGEAIAHRHDGPCAILLRVAHVTGPYFPRDGEGDDFQLITFTDIRAKDSLMTLPVTDKALVAAAGDALEHGRYLVARGALVPGQPSRRDPGCPIRLQLDALHEDFRPSALLGATGPALSQADALIDRLSATPGALERHLLDEFHDIHYVETATTSPRFRQVERAVLLQALSAGQLEGRANPRLSLYVISTPAQGKKVLSDLATLLAPCGSLIEPENSTPAGILARVEQRAGNGWVCVPGALPRSHLGVTILEDFHQFDGARARPLRANLLSILEDGLTVPHKAAEATFLTQAALHINGNRRSQAYKEPVGRDARSRLSDLSLSFDLFSRLDLMIELDPDFDPAGLAIALSKRPARTQDAATLARSRQRERDLQVLVARLLDRIPVVDMAAVEDQVGQVTADAIAVIRDAAMAAGEGGIDPDGLVVRMGNTVRKLVAAAARLDGRSAANLADTQTAWQMISYKLEMVRYLCGEGERAQPLGRREDAVRRAERAAEARFREVLSRFGGLWVTARQVAELLGVNEKLLRRELRQRGLLQERGQFLVPTAMEWEEMKRKAELMALLGQQPPRVAEVEEGAPHPADDDEPDFQDILPPVPSAFDPVLTAFTRMEDWAQRTTADLLISLALEEKVDLAKKLGIQGIKNQLPAGEVMPMPEYKAWLEWLMAADWETRGLAGLSTYVEADLPDLELTLKRKLKEHPDLPPRLREGIEAVIKRLRWFFERSRRNR